MAQIRNNLNNCLMWFFIQFLKTFFTQFPLQKRILTTMTNQNRRIFIILIFFYIRKQKSRKYQYTSQSLSKLQACFQRHTSSLTKPSNKNLLRISPKNLYFLIQNLGNYFGWLLYFIKSNSPFNIVFVNVHIFEIEPRSHFLAKVYCYFVLRESGKDGQYSGYQIGFLCQFQT